MKTRTRGYSKDFIIDALLKLAYDFKNNHFYTNKNKHKELVERLDKLDYVVQKRRELVK